LAKVKVTSHTEERLVENVDNFVHSNPNSTASGNDGIELRTGRITKAWFNIQDIRFFFVVEGDLTNNLQDEVRS
jgi:hypothetical protein